MVAVIVGVTTPRVLRSVFAGPRTGASILFGVRWAMNEYLDVVLKSWNMLDEFTEWATDTIIAAFHPERGFGKNVRARRYKQTLSIPLRLYSDL